MEPSSGRRATDSISAAIELAIRDSAEGTRHALRPEIAAVAARLEATSLIQTREHAEVKTAVAELHSDVTVVKQDVADLKSLLPRVVALETNDAVLEALASNRKWLIGAVTALAGLIVATAGTLVAILH